MKEIITTFLPRLLSETPSFHKKLRNYSAIVAIMIGGLLMASEKEMLIISSEMKNLLVLADVILATIAATSQTAKTDIPNEGSK